MVNGQAVKIAGQGFDPAVAAVTTGCMGVTPPCSFTYQRLHANRYDCPHTSSGHHLPIFTPSGGEVAAVTAVSLSNCHALS